MKNRVLKPLFLLMGILLPIGCTTQMRDQQGQTAQDEPTEYYYYDDGYGYDNWNGPGWYYGIYFSNEAYYRNWHHRHRGGRGYYHGGRRHYHGGHYGGHRGGGHRGGRGRH